MHLVADNGRGRGNIGKGQHRVAALQQPVIAGRAAGWLPAIHARLAEVEDNIYCTAIIVGIGDVDVPVARPAHGVRRAGPVAAGGDIAAFGVNGRVVPKEQPVAVVVEEAVVHHDHARAERLRMLVAAKLPNPGHVQIKVAIAIGITVVYVIGAEGDVVLGAEVVIY